MTSLEVPDNIPADVVDNLKAFVARASEADKDGGIDTYGMFFVTPTQELTMIGVMPSAMFSAVTRTIGTLTLLALGERPCNCPSCVAERKASSKS